METSTSLLLTRILQAGLALLLIFAPLPFGSVRDESIFLLEFTICLLLGIWLCHELVLGRFTLLKTGLHWPIFMLLAYLILTLVPLPSSILGILSPETLRLHEQASETLSSYGLVPSSMFRISLTPFDTDGEILKISVYIAFFFLSVHALRHRRGFVAIYVLLIAYGALMAVFGLVQNTWSNGKIYWRFESGGGSPFGPFVNHNHFAGYLELTLGLSLGMFVAEVQRHREANRIPGISGYFAWIWDKQGGRSWLLLIASFLILAGLAGSLSRGGVLSVVSSASVFTIAALLPSRSAEVPAGAGSPLRKRVWVPVALILIVGLIAVLAQTPRAKSRWQGLYDDAAQYRLDVWRDNLGAIQDFPVTGAGLGSFRSLYPRYKSGSFHSETTHAENEYVQWTVETGFTGLLFACIVVLAFIYRVFSRLKTRKNVYFRSLTLGALFSLVCLSIHNLIDFNMHIPSNALTFAAVAALCLISVNHHQGRRGERFLLEDHHLPLTRVKGVAAFGAILLAIAVLAHQAWAQYQSLSATDQWARERIYLLRGDPEESQFDLLQRALAWSPWNDRAHFLKANAYEAATAGGGGILQLFKTRGFIEQARLAVLEAIRLRPLQAAYWAALGRIETTARNKEASERAFQHALKLAGSNASIRRDYALCLLFSGDTQRGAEQLASARIFGPGLNLRDMLETLVKYTNDHRIWQTLVRNEPGDLKKYAAFLGSRGYSDRAAEVLKQAETLEKTPGRN